MSKIVLSLGLIAGSILALMLGLSLVFMDGYISEQAMNYGEIIGYATMIIALSLVYVGIKSFRDKHQEGKISFVEAFKVGILITIIASVIYVISWMLLSDWLAPDFMDRYAEYTLRAMEEKGADAVEISETKATMDRYIEMYQNPLIKAGMTFMEVFPVGLIISLISAFILKKK